MWRSPSDLVSVLTPLGAMMVRKKSIKRGGTPLRVLPISLSHGAFYSLTLLLSIGPVVGDGSIGQLVELVGGTKIHRPRLLAGAAGYSMPAPATCCDGVQLPRCPCGHLGV